MPTESSIRGIIQFQAVVRGHIERKRLLKLRRHNAYRSRVAAEILETETRYVESLKECIKWFLMPLQNAHLMEEMVPILPKAKIRTIFSDMKILYNFHEQSILSSIRPRVENWNIYQCVGDIFLNIVSENTLNTKHWLHFLFT